MAAIAAAQNGARVIAIDGAKKIGAKILISGGGRCNVTNEIVRAEDFNGSRNAIAKVLRMFEGVGPRPWGIALSPDGDRLYTANGPSDDVAVLDPESGRILRRITVGKLPWGIAVAP